MNKSTLFGGAALMAGLLATSIAAMTWTSAIVKIAPSPSKYVKSLHFDRAESAVVIGSAKTSINVSCRIVGKDGETIVDANGDTCLLPFTAPGPGTYKLLIGNLGTKEAAATIIVQKAHGSRRPIPSPEPVPDSAPPTMTGGFRER